MLKENCHFYTEYPDMGGHIPCCAKYSVLGKCPCDNCNDFLEGSDAEKIIEAYLKKDLIPISVIEQIKAEIVNISYSGHINNGEHLRDVLNYRKDVLETIDRYIKEYEA